MNKDNLILSLEYPHKVALYFAIGLAFMAMIVIMTTYQHIKYNCNERAPYQILKIECIATCFCQLGKIGLIGHKLAAASSLVVCIPSTAVVETNFFMLICTRFYVSRVR